MMKSSLDELVSVVDQLLSRLDEMESRVAALERGETASHTAPVRKVPAIVPSQHPLAMMFGSSSAMPVIGKVFLGLAGAYVLRAVAETGSIPQWMVIAVALAYTGGWLLWAARIGDKAPFASSAYATTAAAILSSMLWELTLRFKAVSPEFTAGLLVLFVAAAIALAWKSRVLFAVWTPAVFAAMTAAGLLVATRDPLPFTIALLVMAMMTEGAAGSGRWLGLRPFMAIAADLALLGLIAIYTGERAAPDYQPIGTGVLLVLFAALFAIYAASVLNRTARQAQEIGIFEIAQTAVAFVVSVWGMLRATQQAAYGLGIFSLLLALVCYLLVFARFDKRDGKLNRWVFSSWAALLLLTGAFFCFPANAASVWLGLAGLAAAFAGARYGRLALELHGAVYLAAAMVASGLLQYSGSLLLGEPPARANWPVWLVGAFTVIGYIVAGRRLRSAQELLLPEPGAGWPQRVLQLILASFATCSVTSAGVAAGLLLLPAIDPPRLAALRTLVICLVAPALGWCGSRLRRAELIWLAYAAIAFCTGKLFFEDLPDGNARTLAISLFCYGMAWLLLPRLARVSKAG
jgi:hypothetical protein